MKGEAHNEIRKSIYIDIWTKTNGIYFSYRTDWQYYSDF